jgi:hypothetical protein
MIIAHTTDVALQNQPGPVFSFTRKAGDADVIAEFKWLKEFDNKNRLEGDVL